MTLRHNNDKKKIQRNHDKCNLNIISYSNDLILNIKILIRIENKSYIDIISYKIE